MGGGKGLHQDRKLLRGRAYAADHPQNRRSGPFRLNAMHAAPGTSRQIDPAAILRAESETDLSCARRQS